MLFRCKSLSGQGVRDSTCRLMERLREVLADVQTTHSHRFRRLRRVPPQRSFVQSLEARALLAGTAVVVDDNVSGGGINNGTFGSGPHSTIEVSGTIYFGANDGVDTTSDLLWRINSSGTAERVEDALPGAGINAASPSLSSWANVNGTLYFLTGAASSNTQLWRINNSGIAETVTYLNSFGQSVLPLSIPFVVNSTAYFTARAFTGITEVYRVNSADVAEQITSQGNSSVTTPANFMNVNGTFFFTAKQSGVGEELWRVNGTGVVELVEDSVSGSGIGVGLNGAYAENFSNHNGTLYFTANDGTNGTELWRVGGTGLAQIVEDAVPGGGIRPGSGAAFNLSASQQFVNVAGTLYFQANDGTNGTELWRINSSGIAEMVEDSVSGGGINPGAANSTPLELTNFNGQLYFRAINSSTGSELWRVNSSGVAELVEDVIPGGGINPGTGTSYPQRLTNVSGALYFRANDGTNGLELWKVGASGIAEQVEDAAPSGGIAPGGASSNPEALLNVNGQLYFRAIDGTNGNEVWRVTSSGLAELVEDSVPGGGIRPGSATSIENGTAFWNLNGQFYASLNDGTSGLELWRINSSGLAETVEDAIPGEGINGASLPSSPTSLTPVNDVVYFTANDGANGVELWRANSSGQAVLVEDAIPGGGLNPGSDTSTPRYMTNVNGTLYFQANDGTNGIELWRINSAGTAVLVEDAVPGGGINPGGSSSPTGLTNVSGVLYFSANDGTNGIELWKVDGTGQAVMVDDSIPGGGISQFGSSGPVSMTNVNSTVYFIASDGGVNNTGFELWRVNTAGIAELVEDSVPGGGIGPGALGASIFLLTNAGGVLYFQADDGTNGPELWRINNSGRAEMVEDAIPGGGIRPSSLGSVPRYMTDVAGTLYFRATDGTNGYELWKIDSSGTAVMVEDSVAGGGIAPGSTQSQPKYLTNVNGTLYFSATDNTNGTELWRINTAGNAEMVEDSIPGKGINPSLNSYPRYMTVANNTLFFQANDGTNGLELWRINSTGSAVMVEDAVPGGGIEPGSGSSFGGFNVLNINGMLLFQAFTSVNGAELWRINAFGVAVMIEDTLPGGGINPGGASSSPTLLTNVNGTLFFSADDGYSNGTELWVLRSSDIVSSLPAPGTPAPTALAPELDAGGNERIFTGDTFRRTISFRDEDSTNLTLSINYGDGTGIQPLEYRKADRSAFLNHVYDKSGVYTVTVVLQDDSVPSPHVVTSTFQMTVLNTPPEIAFNEVLLTKRIREGETVSLSGTFQDLGVTDAHRIEVDWGDGSPVTTQNVPVGARAYALTHRYDDDGASRADSHVYRVVVTVRDQSGASSATPVFLVEVDNVAPTVLETTLNHSQINEGGTLRVDGSFVDPGLLDTHFVSINWGDGSPRQRIATNQIQQTGTLRQFSVSHTFLDNPEAASNYVITVEVSDDDDPLNVVSSTESLIVNNINPTFRASAVGQPLFELSTDEIIEGSELSLRLRITDPGRESHTLIIDWGDGTPAETLNLLPGVETSPILRHTYKNATDFIDFYTIQATISDRDTAPLDAQTVLQPIAVYNSRPTVSAPVLSATGPISEGDELVISGSFSDVALGESYTVVVEWGDGTFTPAEVDEVTRTYSARHKYLDDSPVFEDLYAVQVFVSDGLQFGFAQSFIEVRNVAPTVSVLPVVDLWNPNIVIRAVSQDVGLYDQQEIFGTSPFPGAAGYTWSLTKGGVPVPFTERSWASNEIELDPSLVPSGEEPLILSVTADDGDGGATTAEIVLLLGTTFDEVLTVTDSSLPVDITSALILGLEGNDILDASAVTRTDLSLTIFGGMGDDQVFDGSGNDTIILGAGNDSLNLPQFDFWNSLQVLPNMAGDDEVFLIPNSTLTAYDNIGSNTLNFSLAESALTQEFGVTFDLDQTIDRGFGIQSQDVAPESYQPNEHFVAAFGTFVKLIGSNYADKLTGASNSTVLGGFGADRFFTKDDIVDVTFGGGADADVLTALGLRVARVKFHGDDGADELHVDDFAEVLDDLDFDGGNDADVFINRGRVSRVKFKGGADADILQNQKGRISRIRFQGDDGIDTFINEEIASIEWQDGDDLALQAEQGLDFDGGRDADVLINRGRVSRVVFKGGADADLLQNQKGRISRIRFQGDDGIDTFVNEEIASIEWQVGDDPTLQPDQGIDFDGGDDADLLINRGRVSRVVFRGGADADVLSNQKGRISRIRFQGDDGPDQLINDENDEGASIEWLPGDDPDLRADQGIEFDGGNDADILINRGRVSRVVFRGGSDADIIRNQKGRISRIRFQGDDGVDSLINEEFASIAWQIGDDATLQAEQGIDFDGGNDADILINRGRVSRVVFRGGADADVLQNQKGRVSRIRFQGDDGDDVLFNDEFGIIEWQTGDDPDLQLEQGIDFEGGDDADILINRGRVSRVVFRGGADQDVLQNRSGRITKVQFTGGDGADTFINEEFATIAWQTGDDPDFGADQGIDFDGGDDADVLINRGRVSRVLFRGGADADLLDLQSGEVTDDVLFEGGDDADVLIARSRVRRIRFNGDAGTDEFLITGLVIGEGFDDGLVEFFGGDDADLLVTRGTVRRLVFRGGADDEADDVLQTAGGSIGELEFFSESGVGVLVNRTNDMGAITLTGSNAGNMFINRGQNIGQITFLGASGDDVFVNSGSAKPGSPGILRFDAGDGSNALRNEGTGWTEVMYTGGLGEDFLQNNGGGIGLVRFVGGLGSNAIENNANGISGIVVQGSNDDDIFANDGHNVSGITFDALNGNNTLINTGANVSGIAFDGGVNSDRFFNTGTGLTSSTFNGNAGDDRLYNYGSATRNVTMVGGAGADWWINQASAVGGQHLRLEAGSGDDSGDVLINWAADVSDVQFEGGFGDDLLQNGGVNIDRVQFTGGTGHDLLLNLGNGADRFSFDAGEGDDIFENRGQNGGELRMLGGPGDDAFYQNAGYAADIELNGGDGDDTFLNFSNGMGRVALIGGAGNDILQNTGNDVELIEVVGGAGKNTLQNFGSRIATLRMTASGTFSGAFDTLLNSGNFIDMVQVTSDVPVTVISSGSDIAVISVVGSRFNDVVRISGNRIGSTSFFGSHGDDSLLIDTQSDQSSSVVFHGDAGDDLFLFRGFTNNIHFEGGADDDQVMCAGVFNSALLRGDSGDDLYRFAEFTTGLVTIDEVYSRTLMTDDASRDTLDFSSYRTGAISLDLALVTPQTQWAHFVPLVITLTDGLGIEDVVGTSRADTILGNSRNNSLSGAQYLPSHPSPGSAVARTKTQWVYLDFGSHDDPGEFVYTEAMAVEVKSRIEQAYTGFDVRFVLNTADLPAEIRGDSSKFATLYFNQTPSTGRPGGEASEIDFGNVNPGGFGVVQINGMLGGREVLESSRKAVAAESETADGDLIQAPDIPKPAATVENFIALSAKLGAHELGHLLGLRHYDAFGPVGFGIHSPPGLDVFKPVYSGIAAAFETTDHIISSPASVGSTRFNDLRQLYFGQREAIKLALAFSDESLVRKQESLLPHTSSATAQPLDLVTLDVPNLATGGINRDKVFQVQAASVVGSIGLAGATSESDWYSFTGYAGDVVTIEIMSQALKRYYTNYASSIDSVLRLFNAAGQLVQTFGTDAINDDEFESSDSLLMDVTLPADGSYFIEVDTFRRDVGDASYPAAVALRDELERRRTDGDTDNDLSPDEFQFLARLNDSLNDTDTGSYELLIYRSSSANAVDEIDTIKGREGVDQITGGPGDDYSVGLQASGSIRVNYGSAWNGNYVFTDRGGHAVTTIVDFGDGTAPVVSAVSTTAQGSVLPLSHVYSQTGTFVITISVTNDDGLTASRSLNVEVAGGVTGFDVASGMTQRSWIDSLDILFSSEQMAANLIANPERLRLSRYGLNGPNPDGSGGTQIPFSSASGLSRTGSLLKFNFGSQVIGNNGRNSTAADGYYRLDLDFDGDGLADATRWFYRLLGDVNGDRQVNATDANLILAGMARPYNRELDINGDGVVNNTDRGWTLRSNGRKLKDGLFVND